MGRTCRWWWLLPFACCGLLPIAGHPPFVNEIASCIGPQRDHSKCPPLPPEDFIVAWADLDEDTPRMEENDQFLPAPATVHVIVRNFKESNSGKASPWRTILKGATAGVVGGATAVFAVPAVLGALGFAATGVVAGSAAAAYQSAVLGGTIAQGGWFAVSQSIGMAGLGAVGTAVSSAVGSALAGAGFATHELFNQHHEPPVLPYRHRSSLLKRKREVADIRERYSEYIVLPIVVERDSEEAELPVLDGTVFVATQGVTILQLLNHIGSPMQLSSSILFIGGHAAEMTRTVAEVYLEHADEDGFLYVTYMMQDTFLNKR